MLVFSYCKLLFLHIFFVMYELHVIFLDRPSVQGRSVFKILFLREYLLFYCNYFLWNYFQIYDFIS